MGASASPEVILDQRRQGVEQEGDAHEQHGDSVADGSDELSHAAALSSTSETSPPRRIPCWAAHTSICVTYSPNCATSSVVVEIGRLKMSPFGRRISSLPMKRPLKYSCHA